MGTTWTVMKFDVNVGLSQTFKNRLDVWGIGIPLLIICYFKKIRIVVDCRYDRFSKLILLTHGAKTKNRWNQPIETICLLPTSYGYFWAPLMFSCSSTFISGQKRRGRRFEQSWLLSLRPGSLSKLSSTLEQMVWKSPRTNGLKITENTK